MLGMQCGCQGGEPQLPVASAQGPQETHQAINQRELPVQISLESPVRCEWQALTVCNDKPPTRCRLNCPFVPIKDSPEHKDYTPFCSADNNKTILKAIQIFSSQLTLSGGGNRLWLCSLLLSLKIEPRIFGGGVEIGRQEGFKMHSWSFFKRKTDNLMSFSCGCVYTTLYARIYTCTHTLSPWLLSGGPQK